MAHHTLFYHMQRGGPAAGNADPFELLSAGFEQSDLADVNALLRSTVEQVVTGPLAEIVSTHLATGGKQIRARLVLTFGRMLDVDNGGLIYLAAALEALHNATLIHDDLQDGDTERRGNPTTWIRWGMNQAITAGDLMLMLPTTLVCDAPVGDAERVNIAAAIAKRSIETACGQSLETTLSTADGFTWAEYAAASVGKTGAFFALPIEVTCLAARMDRAEARAIADAALPLGLLYQLQDDVRDLYAAKGRDRRGNDLREGKPSALVAAHIELHPHEAADLVKVLRASRDRTSDGEVAYWTARFAESGALDLVATRAMKLMQDLENNDDLRAVPALSHSVLSIASWCCQLVESAQERSTLSNNREAV